jgi:hypothetical protein
MAKCPNTQCAATCRVPDELAGKRVVCKACKTRFAIGSNNGVLVQKKTGAIPHPEATEQEPLPLPDEDIDAEPLPLPDDDHTDEKKSKRRRFAIMASAGAVGFLIIFGIIGIPLYYYVIKQSQEIYGGIEITSSEIRASVYEFFPDTTLGFDFKKLSESPWNEKIQWKFSSDGDFDTDTLKQTVAVIARLHKEIQKKHKVKPDKIVIVCGSSVLKKINGKENQARLDGLVLEATGQHIKFVDSKEEFDLQTSVLIPETLIEKTVLVDLGNGGCRGGCKTKSDRIPLEAVGVTEFSESMINRANTLKSKPGQNPKLKGDQNTKPEIDLTDDAMDRYIAASAAIAMDDSTGLRKSLRKAIQDNGELTGRKRIELIGGIPWVVATFKNPSGRDQTHTRLTVKQMQEFYTEVRHFKTYPPLDLPSSITASLKKKLEDDREQMPKSIRQEKLIASTEILKVLAEELRFNDPGREIYFHNYGQEAIVLAFMQRMWEQATKK